MFWQEYSINDHKILIPNSYIDRSLWKIKKIWVTNCFYNTSHKEHIRSSEYKHAFNFWNIFSFKTLGKYYNLYKKSNIMLHGNIIGTGITCKKIHCYMHGPAFRWLIVENAKIFQSYVKHFWIFLREKSCKILIG